MPARLSAFVIWALVAASAVFWGLRLAVSAPGAPAHTVSVSDAAPVRADLSRLLGAPPVAATAAAPAAPALASRFQLAGVMAPKVPGQQGVALIAVDGKMARAFRVGAAVDGELTLQSVSLRSASIGPARGQPAVVLELPPLPPPATGSLPPPQTINAPAAGNRPAVAAAPAPVAPVAPNAAPRPAPSPPPGGRLAPSQPSRAMGTMPRSGPNVQTR